MFTYMKNIYIRWIYECASWSLYNRNVCYSKTKIHRTRENLKHCIDSNFVSYKIGNINLFSSITQKRLPLVDICHLWYFIFHAFDYVTNNKFHWLKLWMMQWTHSTHFFIILKLTGIYKFALFPFQQQNSTIVRTNFAEKVQ